MEAARDNHLNAERYQILYRSLYCTYSSFAHLPLKYWFCSCISRLMSFSSYLFVFLLIHESFVLFLLSRVVLVLYSYQESTLFVKALDPFNENKTLCKEFKSGFCCMSAILSRTRWRITMQNHNSVQTQ